MAVKEAVAVLNCGNNTYSEEWNGDLFEIPAKKAISMNRRDAVTFLGRMSAKPEGDPAGLPIEKNLRIVPLDEAKSFIVKEYRDIVGRTPQKFVSNYDGREFTSQEALDAHLATLSDKALKDEDDVMKEPETQDPTGMVTCPFCNKNDLKGAIGLQNHIKHCPSVKKTNGVNNDNTGDDIFAD